MSSSAYLDMLDEWLGRGIAGLTERFVEAQIRFVAGCQQADGGFRGRQGDSDLYYTDFALRTLAWLAPGHAAFEEGLRYMARLPSPPGDTLECFHVLNARRLSLRHGEASTEWMLDAPQIAGRLRAASLSEGGFARSAGDTTISAYHTFIGTLCTQMLGIEMCLAQQVTAAIASLRCLDGGYAELAGQTKSQTSATAAAVAVLLMHDALPAECIAEVARFLAGMQAPDGGLKPHAAVEQGDMLSTFTGLVTLCGLGELRQIDTVKAAQFLRTAAHPDGGFAACPGDSSPDVEYTYYGVATLALLRITVQ